MEPDLDRQLLNFRSEFREGHVRTGGFNWQFALGGKGEQSLIILGGLGATHESMFEVALGVAKRHKVLCVSIPNGCTHPDQVVDGTTEVLKRLDIERPVLLGHSMGGMACLAIALANPAGIRSLILSHTGIYLGVRRILIPLAAGCLARLPQMTAKSLILKQMDRLLESSADRQFWRLKFETELGDMTMARSHSELLPQLSRFLSSTRLGPLADIKALIIQAADDKGYTSLERSFLSKLFRAPTVVDLPVPSGHLSFITQKQPYLTAVNSFMEVA